MNGDRVKCQVSAGGTGALTLGAAVSGFRTAAAAGLGDSGYVSYLAEWPGGWAVGFGTLSVDALTLTRVAEWESSTNNAVDAAAPFADVPGSGATVALAPDSRSSGLSTRTGVPGVSGPQVRSLDCFAVGGGSIGAGSANALVFGTGVVDDACPNALVLGSGGAYAPHAVSIGPFAADQHGELVESHGENALPARRFKLLGQTANATPADLFLNAGATLRPVIPAGFVWLVRAFVAGVVSNAPGAIGNAYARELRALGKPTGQVGATVSTAIAADAGFTGSATMSIDASGNVKVTVTGMAGNTIMWSAHVEATPVEAS